MIDLVQRLYNANSDFGISDELTQEAAEKIQYQDEVIEQRNAECSRNFHRIAELETTITELEARPTIETYNSVAETCDARLSEVIELEATITKLTNELAACRSEQEIGYEDARQQQATIAELTAVITRLANDRQMFDGRGEDWLDWQESELAARLAYARAALKEKT